MPPAKRLNVLIYAGPGSSLPSVRHTTWTLRRLLGPHYAVISVTADQVLKEPWPASCALFVMPGGGDLGYCRMLNGEGNRRIKQYVQMGGKYLGLCAGGYYGCNRCEFEVADDRMRVVGDRELAFFPGVCRGAALKGFEYDSEAGARAPLLSVAKKAFGELSVPEHFRSYYNGGGTFVDAHSLSDKGVEVLATYENSIDVNPGKGGAGAAVVFCKNGEGVALLTGPHPEFSGANLDRSEPSNPNYAEIVDALIADDKQRTAFLRACIIKLGLDVSDDSHAVPSLSSLHLSCLQAGDVKDLFQSWETAGIITHEADQDLIKGENDTFRLQTEEGMSMSSIAQAVSDIVPQAVKDAVAPLTSALPASLPTVTSQQPSQSSEQADKIIDYNEITKTLVLHPSSSPYPKETPQFNHNTFYAHLSHLHSRNPTLSGDFGRTLLYGEVITSTNTLLEKNPTLLSHLPIGTTATATTQIAGRGRGTNVWVSPPGSLMFSTVMKHSLSLSSSAPVVFVQYLAALAIVQGIKTYDKGYDRIPVRLKWPNDIYALLDPNASPTARQDPSSYTKIGGILVTSSYAGGDYTLVVGIGLNVNNALPTTSLSHLAQKSSPPLLAFSLERLLAAILVQFESLYASFCARGFDQGFLDMYYTSWLHGGQKVTLEMEDGARARVKGISQDWGLLVVEELKGVDDRPTGRIWQLQSDANSFDFFKGLVKIRR